jgi:hypothetical protein
VKRPVALAVTILATIALTGGTAAASSDLFGTPVTYDTQAASHAAAIADVNGDGKNDLIITNAADGTEPNTVMVRLGNGNGTFGSPAFYGTGDRPKSTAIADLNGDGKLDLATANQNASTTSILLGNGDGTFRSKTDYATCNHGHEVALGDFNHDGKRDLAVACWGGSVISILLGNGNGTFGAKTDIGSGLAPHSLVVGRFNADTYDDLAVANHGGDTVGVLLGTSGGSFASVVTYAVGSKPHSVRSGDFNKDGKTDLATANDGSDDVSVLPGRGDGTFGGAVSYAAGSVPKSVAVGDLDGDGNLDLTASDTGGNGDGITGLPNGNLISILLGNGDGTFRSPTTEVVGEAPYSAVIGNLDGDACPDIASASWDAHSATVLLNTCDAPPPPPPGSPTISAPKVSIGPSTVATNSFSLRLTWTASDATGLASFAVRRSVDGGVAATVAILASSARSYTTSVVVGHRYEFWVRATDDAAASTLSASTGVLQPALFTEGTSHATYHGTWSRSASTAYLGGAARISTHSGADVTIAATGRAIAWVGSTGPKMGKAKVYVDGVYRSVVDLYSATNMHRRVVLRYSWSTIGPHTIKVVSSGTKSRPRIVVDGVAVIR